MHANRPHNTAALAAMRETPPPKLISGTLHIARAEKTVGKTS